MLRELGGTFAFETKINPFFKKYRGRVQRIFGCCQNYSNKWQNKVVWLSGVTKESQGAMVPVEEKGSEAGYDESVFRVG